MNNSRPPPRQPLGEAQKRAQVPAACSHCRRRKVKCDALRPCNTCTTRNLVCQYETEQGETSAQATKRKHDETSQKMETLEDFFSMIEHRGEDDAAAIVRWIRSGHDARAIVQLVKSNDTGPDVQKSTMRNLLVSLAHSTGSLEQVIRFAMLIPEASSGIDVPPPREFNVFRNRIVRLPYLENMMQMSRASYQIQPSLLNTNAERARDEVWCRTAVHNDTLQDGIGMADYAPHRVPAIPWTTLAADDDAVSHLVSLFLVWINPTWQFVESDLFLQGMRSKQMHSEYCSRFLVNSILAIASLHSEHDVAFSDTSQNRITRGQHFHEEAMRLWILEENHPSITNMQALCILGLESNLRAKDALGLTLVPIAAQLDKRVPMYSTHKYCEDRGVLQRDLRRVRLSTHWMVKCTNINMRIAFLSGTIVEASQSRMPRIHDVFNDVAEVWTGYPLTNIATLHRPTVFLRERCSLAEIFHDIDVFMTIKHEARDSTVREFCDSMQGLLTRLRHWYQRLPFEVQYRWPMSTAVWELHASYLSFSMVFRLLARNRLREEEVSSTGQTPLTETDEGDPLLRVQKIHEHSTELIRLARWAAQNLREYRERYGLKITPAWLLHLQAVAAGILVLDPEVADTSTADLRTTSDPGGKINDSAAAFDEVFRCLLGGGVEVMISRAIARMTYHTALENDVVLSAGTRKLLQVMAETAWHPSDVKLVNSVFPNFATIEGHHDTEDRITELLTKWEGLEIGRTKIPLQE